MPRLGLTSNNSTLWVNLKRADSQMSLATKRDYWRSVCVGLKTTAHTLKVSIPVLLISSQDAAINIEHVPEELAPGIQTHGVCERCAFIIKVNWDALKHLRC